MSVIDLASTEQPDNAQTTTELQSTQANTDNVQQVAANIDNKAPEGKEPSIILDGPLSEIYTKALNVVYANNAPDEVGQESQAIDAVIATNIFLQQNEEKAKLMSALKPDDTYVYVTSTDDLEGSGLTDAFNTLQPILDADKDKSVVVCVESSSIVTTHQALLIDYLTKANARVFHNRDSTMAYLRSK